MATRQRKPNRGPAAAPGNREAILRAARRVFSARGYRAPLSAIAREAGVGQGVLYRHFPTRLDLALAVFEDNFAQLEQLGSDGSDRAFEHLWRRLSTLVVEEAAFIEMTVDARRSLPDYEGGRRLRDLVEPLLVRARDAGLVDPSLGIEDLGLLLRASYGLVATADDVEGARAAVTWLMGRCGLPGPDGPVVG